MWHSDIGFYHVSICGISCKHTKNTPLPDTFLQYCHPANNMQQQTTEKQNPNQTISRFYVLFMSQQGHPTAICFVHFHDFYNWLSRMSVKHVVPAGCQRRINIWWRGYTIDNTVSVCEWVLLCLDANSRCWLWTPKNQMDVHTTHEFFNMTKGNV